GLRDFHVTGVQTCALPILVLARDAQAAGYPLDALRVGGHALLHVFGQHADQLERGLRVGDARPRLLTLETDPGHNLVWPQASGRSEERRVGEERKARQET